MIPFVRVTAVVGSKSQDLKKDGPTTGGPRFSLLMVVPLSLGL